MEQDTKENPDINNFDNMFNSNGDNSKFKVKASNLFKKHKSKFLGGGVAGLGIGLIVFAFTGIATYELQTIAKDINNYEDKIVHEGMSSASKTILSKLVCFKMGILCKEKSPKSGNPNNDPAATEGEGLAFDEQKFNFNDPQVKSLLESKGITPQFDPEGNFTGFTGPDGSPITPADIANDTNGVFEDLDKAMPEFSFGQITSFRDLMFKFANSDFNILPDNPSTSTSAATEDIVNADTFGAEGSVAANELTNSFSDSEEQTNNTSSATQAAENSALSDATDATNALSSTDKNIALSVEHGVSVDTAENIASSSFRSQLSSKFAELGPGTLIGITQDLCLFDKLVNNQIVKHIPLIMSLLIRNGTTTISLASQLTSGKVTGKEVAAAMKLFNGSSNPLDKNTNAALPFSASSAWAQATGSKGGVPIDPTSLPTVDGVMKVMQPINKILDNTPGARAVCDASNSTLGGIAITIGGIFGQGGIDIASFGTAEAITAAVQLAAVTAIYVAVPYVAKEMLPVNLMGFQNAVQNMNNTDAGLNLANNNYYRTMGGMPQTKTQSINNNIVADNYIQHQQSQESWYQRTFALSNPYSLISRFAVNIPLSFNSTVFDVVNYLQKIPEELLHNFSLLFISPNVFADSQNSYPGSSYGTTQYASSNSTINGYDPIANESYLFSNVTYNGKSEKRIQMLGDPNKITPTTGDSSTNDLLHCFYDSYTTIYSAATGGGATTFNPSTPPHLDPGADKNCGALGLYNLQDYGDNGNNGPIDGMPNNTTIADIYCHYLNGSASSQCVKTLLSDGQINNDLQHYRQYLMDLSVMNNYMSMMSTSQ